MTIKDYLRHRKRYEVIAVTLILLAIATTNATSLIIEDYQNAREPSWLGHWATEFTVIVVVPLQPDLEVFSKREWIYYWRVLSAPSSEV